MAIDTRFHPLSRLKSLAPAWWPGVVALVATPLWVVAGAAEQGAPDAPRNVANALMAREAPAAAQAQPAPLTPLTPLTPRSAAGNSAAGLGSAAGADGARAVSAYTASTLPGSASAPNAATAAAAAAAAAATAGGSNPAPQAFPRASRSASVACLISPERVADIGTPVAGVVSDIAVERGDKVKKGQTLVLLESGVEQAGIQAAQARAQIDADVHAAQANLSLARQRFERAAGLAQEGFVAAQAVEQARAERDVAEQKLHAARGQVGVQKQELGVVRAQLGQRTLRSPFTGVVAERFVNAGERVEDRPLLRVVMLDPLRVELVMPASRWGSVRYGDGVALWPELPGAERVTAHVTHVDALLDAPSNTFRVRLSLPNPGHKLPAGARCKLDNPGAVDAAQGAPAAAGQPSARLQRGDAQASLRKAATTQAAAATTAAPATATVQTGGLRPIATQPPRAPQLRFSI